MNAHTPGPWSVWEGPQYEGGGADLCIGAGEDWLANMDHRARRCTEIHTIEHREDECDICTIDSGEITDEQRANARLIAAAPDLLAALKAALAAISYAEKHFIGSTSAAAEVWSFVNGYSAGSPVAADIIAKAEGVA